MDLSPASLTAHHEAISAVFQAGMPVYLRRKIAGMDKIVLVTCASTSPGTLVMQWPASATAGVPPRTEEEVTCQCLLKGVLYIATGKVEEITQGKQPRLRLRVGETCIAVALRSSPRYRVSGRLRLSQTEGLLVYGQNSFHSINISLGGFGTELDKDAWMGGDEVYFVLDLLIERNGVADENLPGLMIEGQGLIRRRYDIPEHNAVYIGIQFTVLEQELLDSLEFWLAAHSSYMRAE
jgi:hypothetical protein